MKIGLPKEIKDNEYRVGLTPAGVQALADAGHELFVEEARAKVRVFRTSNTSKRARKCWKRRTRFGRRAI